MTYDSFGVNTTNSFNTPPYDNKGEGLELAKRAVEIHIKERLIEEITKLQDFDRLMKIKESVEIWAKTKI